MIDPSEGFSFSGPHLIIVCSSVVNLVVFITMQNLIDLDYFILFFSLIMDVRLHNNIRLVFQLYINYMVMLILMQSTLAIKVNIYLKIFWHKKLHHSPVLKDRLFNLIRVHLLCKYKIWISSRGSFLQDGCCFPFQISRSLEVVYRAIYSCLINHNWLLCSISFV